MSLQVEEIVCPVPAEYKTTTTIRLAQFADGLWRHGMVLSAEFFDKKLDRMPDENGKAFLNRDAAFNDCCKECIANWRAVNDLRVAATIAWLQQSLEDAAAPVDAPEVQAPPAAVEPTPVVQPTAPAAAPVGHRLIEQTLSMFADDAFARFEFVKLKLRATSPIVAEIHLGEEAGMWHWALWAEWVKLDQHSPLNLQHRLSLPKLDSNAPGSPCAATKVAAELAAAEALKDILSQVCMRSAVDVGRHIEALKAGEETDAERSYWPDAPMVTVEPVAAPQQAEATAAVENTSPATHEAPAADGVAIGVDVGTDASKTVVVAAETATGKIVAEGNSVAAVSKELAAYKAKEHEIEQELSSAHCLLEDLTEQRKDAKKNLKEIVGRLRDLRRAGPPRPVATPPSELNGCKANATEPAGGTATLTLGTHGPVEVATVAKAPKYTGNWRDVPFAELKKYGLSAGLVDVCAENPKMPIKTFGDWADWCSKHQVTEIAKVGQAKAERISDAYEKFWKDNPELAR